MKTPCLTCDRPIDPNKPCRGCSTLATFGALRPVDHRGRGDLGFEGYSFFYDEPERAPRPGPRFLCLYDLELLALGDIDAHGVDVTGEDDNGIWLGTRDAPCVVPGGGETLFILHGHHRAEEWTGFYIGGKREALAAVPDDVLVRFIEEIAVNPLERYLVFR